MDLEDYLLELLVDVPKNTDIEIIVGNIDRFTDAVGAERRAPHENTDRFKHFFDGVPISTSIYMKRNMCFVRIGDGGYFIDLGERKSNVET